MPLIRLFSKLYRWFAQQYDRLGLGQKIIIPFLSVFLTVLILGALILGIWFTRALEANLYNEVESFSTRVIQDLENVQKRLDSQTRIIATQEVIQTAMATGDRTLLLQQLLPLKAEFSLDLIKAVDGKGEVLVDSRQGFLYQALLEDSITISSASSGLYLTDILTAGENQALLIAVAPVKSSEGILGGIIVGLSIDHELMQQIAAGSSKEVVAFLNQQVIAASNPRLLKKRWLPLSIKQPAQPIKINQANYIAKSAALIGRSQKSLTFQILYPVARLTQAIDSLWVHILLLSGFGTATVIVIGALIARAIAAKLNAQFQQLQHTLQDLRETQAHLIQAEKMSSLGQMVAGIAHEINNPANFIHGNITHLKNYIQDLLKLIHLYGDQAPAAQIQTFSDEIDLDYLQADSDKILKSMKTGTERITQIVLSLRNFSRLDESDMKRVDFHEGIESTLLLLNHRIGQRITIKKEYSDYIWLECYPAQINQLLFNLFINAIDAIEERLKTEDDEFQGEILVQTSQRNPYQVSLQINDNGCGMSAETQHKLFDPFFTTKPVGQGTGLGMAIVYQIIQQHQGIIQVESQVGQGTQLVVTLPIHQAH